MRIEVTADDIRHGERRECERCPIARAVQRATNDGAWSVCETSTSRLPGFSGDPDDVHNVYVVGKQERGGYDVDPDSAIRLPREVSRFIDAFDSGHDVEPFSFEIEMDL